MNLRSASMPRWKMDELEAHMNGNENQPSGDGPAKPPCLSASAPRKKVSTRTCAALDAK